MTERSFVVSASYDQSLRVYDVARGKQIGCVTHADPQINHLALTDTGGQLGVACWQRAKIYDMLTLSPNPVVVLDGLVRNVTAIGFQSEGRWLYTGGEDNSCRVYDVRGGTQLVCQRIFETTAAVSSVALHPNQVELFLADTGGNVYCWDLRADAHDSLPVPFANTHKQFISRLAVHPNGSLLAAVTNRGNLLRWNLTVGEGEESDELAKGDGSRFTRPTPFHAHSTYALSCRFSPRGDLLVTTSAEELVRLFDGISNAPLQELHECGSWVWDAAISDDSSHLVLGNAECKAHLVNISTGQIINNYEGHAKPITSVVLHDAIC